VLHQLHLQSLHLVLQVLQQLLQPQAQQQLYLLEMLLVGLLLAVNYFNKHLPVMETLLLHQE
jgi:hypothetical protein